MANIFKKAGKAFEKVIHNPVVQTVFPVFALANVVASGVIQKEWHQLTDHAGAPSNVRQSENVNPFQQGPPQIIEFPQPYAPSYGSFQDPYYNPNFQGGSPWDSSTQFQVFSTPQSPTYSAPRQDRTWEDLITLGAGLFL